MEDTPRKYRPTATTTERKGQREGGVVLSGNQRSEFLEIPARCYQQRRGWQESTMGADFGLLDSSMTNIREAAQLLLWDWTCEAKSSLCHFLFVGGQTWCLRASVSSSANWFLYQVCCEDRWVSDYHTLAMLMANTGVCPDLLPSPSSCPVCQQILLLVLPAIFWIWKLLSTDAILAQDTIPSHLVCSNNLSGSKSSSQSPAGKTWVRS